MAEARGASETTTETGADTGTNYGLVSAQLSWMRSDLSNLRTLLAWARTSVSMIGFGFTIYNFYRGFLEELGGMRGDVAAKNLGLALVGAGTLGMAVAVWNYWSINQHLDAVARDVSLHIALAFQRRWIYSYVVAMVIAIIGFVTFLFMLRVI